MNEAVPDHAALDLLRKPERSTQAVRVDGIQPAPFR